MGVFFSGFTSGDTFNKFATVLEKLKLVRSMYALHNVPVISFASEDAHMMETWDYDNVTYNVEVITEDDVEWYGDE